MAIWVTEVQVRQEMVKDSLQGNNSKMVIYLCWKLQQSMQTWGRTRQDMNSILRLASETNSSELSKPVKTKRQHHSCWRLVACRMCRFKILILVIKPVKVLWATKQVTLLYTPWPFSTHPKISKLACQLRQRWEVSLAEHVSHNPSLWSSQKGMPQVMKSRMKNFCSSTQTIKRLSLLLS